MATQITFIPQGASISSFVVSGQNIVQTLPSNAAFASYTKPYLGETIGRISNRIGSATLRGLNGKDYPLHANNGTNCLHGGAVGWGKKIWSGPQQVQRNGKEAQLFTYVSKDGEEGFPGTVEARVWYIVTPLPEKGKGGIQLDAEYEVELLGEAEETVVAVTNHAYFNLSGKPTTEGHIVNFGTTDHLPVDADQLPTGEISAYPSLPGPNQNVVFTATDPFVDHCMIVDRSPSTVPLDTRGRELKRLVSLQAPDTGVKLEVTSTEPAFQFFTGEAMDIPATEGSEFVPKEGLKPGDQHGLKGEVRTKRAGFAIEPSRYVDCVNRPEWRGMVHLKKGRIYGSHNRYVAWSE